MTMFERRSERSIWFTRVCDRVDCERGVRGRAVSRWRASPTREPAVGAWVCAGHGRDFRLWGSALAGRRLAGVRELVVQAPGALLAVRESRLEGEPLVLLHGGPGVPDSMQTTIAPLLPQMRHISFDQRGTGSSRCTDGRYGIGAYLADMEAIREDLGIWSWHVLGHSWGGLLAQAYTAGHGDRVRSLVLSSSSLGVGHRLEADQAGGVPDQPPARRAVGHSALVWLRVAAGRARSGPWLGDAACHDRDLAQLFPRAPAGT